MKARVDLSWRSCTTFVFLALLVVPALAKEKKEPIERYEANAMSLDAGRTSMMQIGILGWSTDEDRQALINAFQEGGDHAMYQFLSRQDEKAFVNPIKFTKVEPRPIKHKN